MAIVRVGIDLAKNVFALHGVNEGGAVGLRQPKVARAKLGALVAALPPCTIGIEACSGAHHWARQFQAHGHTVHCKNVLGEIDAGVQNSHDFPFRVS